MKYFVNITTAEELKKEFRRLSIELHPDRNNGNDEAFKMMLAEYEEAAKRFGNAKPAHELFDEWEEFKKTVKDVRANGADLKAGDRVKAYDLNEDYNTILQGFRGFFDFVIYDDENEEPADVNQELKKKAIFCEISNIIYMTDEELNVFNFFNGIPSGCCDGGTMGPIKDSKPANGWGYDDDHNHYYNIVTMVQTPTRCAFLDPQGHNYTKYIYFPYNVQNWQEWEEAKTASKAEYERKQEEARKAEEEKKAAERAVISNWRSILEQLPPLHHSKPWNEIKDLPRAERKAQEEADRKADRKAKAARLAAFKRNIKAVINHYFPELDVKISDSSKAYFNTSEISWTDGPTVDELKNIEELYYFIASGWAAAGPYDDYGHKYTVNDWLEWRDLFGEWSGMSIEFSRTLSERNENAINNAFEAMGAEWEGRDENGKITSSTGTAIISSLQLDKFISSLGGSLDYREDEDADPITKAIRNYYWHADFVGNAEDGGSRYRVYASCIRRIARDYYRIPKAEQEAKKAEDNAPKFTAKHNDTYKAIIKALGGSIFVNLSDDKKWPNHTELNPTEAAEAIAEGKAVALGRYYDFNDGRGVVQTKAGGEKTQQKRADKFAAVGFEIVITWSVYSDVTFSSVTPDTLAELRKDAEDVERQRKEWEEKTAKESQTKTAKESEPKAEAETVGAPDGLELVAIPGGVAVVETKRNATFKHRKEIRANGGDWNKEAKQWQALNPEDVARLRAWFGLSDDEPTATEKTDPQSEPQGAEVETVDEYKESKLNDQQSEEKAVFNEDMAQSFADLFTLFADITTTGNDAEEVKEEATGQKIRFSAEDVAENADTSHNEEQTATGQKIRFSADDVPELDELNGNDSEPTPPTGSDPQGGGAPDGAEREKIRQHFTRYAKQSEAATEANEHTKALYLQALALIYKHGATTLKANDLCNELQAIEKRSKKARSILPTDYTRRQEIQGELITLCVSEYGEELAGVLFGVGTVAYHLQKVA